jgi:hypothetical protein
MSMLAQVDSVGATSSASTASASAAVAASLAAVAVSADAIATLRVALRAVTALPLDFATATAGLRLANELHAVFQRSVDACATSVPVCGPVAKRPRLDPAPLRLLDLPPDILLLVFCRLDSRSLVRIAATCSMLYRDCLLRPMSLVEEVLRERAIARGYVSPVCLPEGGATSWVPHLAWLECRRDEAWMPVAARTSSSFFVAEGGRVMSCGTEEVVDQFLGEERLAVGVLGHGFLEDELDEDDDDADTVDTQFIVSAPTLLSSMVGIRVSGVFAGEGFGVAVSVAGNVYTWGDCEVGQLGHGDEVNRLIPRQVRALAGHCVRSVSTSYLHCLAVTESGEVFSWGYNTRGQCGHTDGPADDFNSGVEMLPRRVEALARVRARSASAGNDHSLVVTEEGIVYSFGGGSSGQLGHGAISYDICDPMIVDALRHVRIVATAAGDFHSIALTADGVVFSWGCNEYGQLGLWQVGEDVAMLQEVALPQKVEALCGLNVCAVVAADTASCAITTMGELFTWGDGESGRLGHGDDAKQLAPKRVDNLRDEWVVAVTCGNRHAMAVVRDGGVFGWGCVDGLGLPEAEFSVRDDGGVVFLPCRYQQLSCVS